MKLSRKFSTIVLLVMVSLCFQITTANADVLNVYLLAGQSNMEGQAYTYNSTATANWNVTTLEFLLSGSPAATAYWANLPFSFKDSLDADPNWLNPRDDVWAVHYYSGDGSVKDVLPTNDPVDIVSGIQPLMPGFGVGTNNGSMIGPELGMGIRLGDDLESPVFLFKSDRGGTTLGINWRPPSAVAARGGAVGADYANTMTSFIEFLDALDADLADDNVLNDYDNATGYVVSGVFWLQGWNEKGNAQLEAEYADNLKDLIYSIRAADARIPNDLPLVIGESSDQHAALNTARLEAVAQLNAEIPGSAAYFDTDNMIGVDWGNNDLGVPFTQGWGYHFHARAENFLEIGWKAAGSVLDNGFYLDDQTPLQFPAVGVSDANSVVDTVSVYGTITANADQVMVYWDSVDQGATQIGWSGSDDLGAWSGGFGRIPAILTGLQPDTAYAFRYWADSSALADDAWSRAGEAKTDFSEGQVPSDMDAIGVSFAQIDLTWSEDFNTESGFLLRRGDDSEFTVNVVDVDLPANAVFYSDVSVTAGSTYYYQVAAHNAYGLSDFSVSVSITAPEIPVDQSAVLTAYYDFEPTQADDPNNPVYDPNSPLYDPNSLDDPDRPLYDQAGAFADDLIGYNATWSADVPAIGSMQSASFAGNTALFTNAYSSDLGPDPSAYTIMFWVKGRDEEQENSNMRLMTSRTRPDGSNASNPAWQVEGFGNNGSNGTKMDLRANNGSALLFTEDAKSGAIGALANTGQETVWHHVVFIVANSGHPDDAGAYAETFFDGVPVGVVNLDPSWDGINIANTDGQLIIGSTAETGSSRDFTGLLDDVALFSGIVSAEDIAAIAAGTLSPGSFLIPDNDPPTPDPMTFASVPAAVSDTAITMTATTATDDKGVKYYFTCTAGGGNDSGWQDSPVYTDTGLTPGTAYTYTVTARDKSANQNETAASEGESASTDAPDLTPPTPDEMTWASVPAATGSTSITMTATTATDDNGVEYYFTCTVGGGNDSGWQDSPIYTDTGLTPETAYTYTVKARDKSANQNATAESTAESATTTDAPSITANLVAYWPFDDNAYDMAGDNHGTLAGNASYVSGKLGKAVSCSADGSEHDYVQFDTTSDGLTGDWTAAAWIYVHNQDIGCFIDGYFGDPNDDDCYGLRLPGQYQATSNPGMTDYVANLNVQWDGILSQTQAYTPPAGTWALMVFVGSDTQCELFADGVSQGTIVYTEKDPEMQFKLTWDRLGSYEKYGSYGAAKADYDELAIWSRALSTDEIAWLYNGGAGNAIGGDGGFDFVDFSIFASNWLRSDCIEANLWCDGSDSNGDESVNESDLREFVAGWLVD